MASLKPVSAYSYTKDKHRENYTSVSFYDSLILTDVKNLLIARANELTEMEKFEMASKYLEALEEIKNGIENLKREEGEGEE